MSKVRKAFIISLFLAVIVSRGQDRKVEELEEKTVAIDRRLTSLELSRRYLAGQAQRPGWDDLVASQIGFSEGLHQIYREMAAADSLYQQACIQFEKNIKSTKYKDLKPAIELHNHYEELINQYRSFSRATGKRLEKLDYPPDYQVFTSALVRALNHQRLPRR